VDLGEYLFQIESSDAALAAFERAVDLAPAEPPSPERAYALGSLAGALMVVGCHAESLPISEQALALARRVGAREAEVRALTVLAGDLAHLGRASEVSPSFAGPFSSPRKSAISSAWNGPTSTSPTR